MSTRPVESTSVMRLASHFLATHSHDGIVSIISNPEKDIAIAKLAARIFAEKNHIYYDHALYEPNPFLVTVLKHHQQWFPGKVNGKEFTVLTGIMDGSGKFTFGFNTQEEAIECAEEVVKLLAPSMTVGFVPAIGIAFNAGREAALSSAKILLQNISENSPMTYKAYKTLNSFDEIQSNAPRILHLRLDGAKINDTELEAIVRDLPYVKTVYVSNSSITNVGLQHLKKLRLERLTLRDCPCLTDAGLASLDIPSMEHLDIRGCQQVIAGATSLYNRLPSLQQLVSDRKQTLDN